MLNEAKITMNEARDLVANQALWPLVRDFLWDFVPQVHESWLEALGRDELGARSEEGNRASLFSSLKSSSRIKEHISAALGISPCFHTFPKDDWSRLLLLDGTTIELIAKWLGALICADELRRVTNGAMVRELKVSMSGVYPEVFGYTMYFKGMKEVSCMIAESQSDDSGMNGEAVLQKGLVLLLQALSGLSSSLVYRLKLKLPKSFCVPASLHEAKKGKNDIGAVITKLLKLKFPEAYSLCC